MYSLQTRMKALAIAGMMAASVAGSAVTAFAAETFEHNRISVTKNVYYPAQGVTLPDTLPDTLPNEEPSFGFTATFQSSSLASNTDRGNAPEKFTAAVKTDKWSQASEGTWTGSADLTVDNQNFSWNDVTPGEYVYELSENAINSEGSYTSLDSYGYGWTYNKGNTKYKLRVYVKNNTGTNKAENPKIVTYTLINTANETGKEAGSEDYNGGKVATASFSNIYTARGGSKTGGGEEDPALTVSKTANGEYDDKTKQFNFTITFTYPLANEKVKPHYTEDKELVEGIIAKKYKSSGTEDAAFSLTPGTGENTYTFSLADGEKVAFVNLPAGTTYTITEAADSQYSVAGFNYQENAADNTKTEVDTSKWQSVKSGTAFVARTADDNSAKEFLIGEYHNEINFTNTRDTITITGVVTHSAPFVIMVGALFVAVGGYVVLKKKIEE